MALRRKEYNMVNSAAISASAQFFPFTQSGAPSELDKRENFPLKNFKVENKSGVPVTFLLDPIGNDSQLKFTVPNGQTLQSQPEDDFKFYNVAIINEGAIDVAIGDLLVAVRNY